MANLSKEELFERLFGDSGRLDEYVILKRDDKGFYIEYAFKPGAPHDNRCLSWYDSYQESAYERNGWFNGMTEEEKARRKDALLKKRLDKVGKIFRFSSFTCGGEENPDGMLERNKESWEKYHPGEPFIPEEHICKVGKPALKCMETHAHCWTYSSPVKCACWHLGEELKDKFDVGISVTTNKLYDLLNQKERRNSNEDLDPEPKYRPYKDEREAYQEALKHNSWYIDEQGRILHVEIITDQKLDCKYFRDMLALGWKWADDNSLCGIKED